MVAPKIQSCQSVWPTRRALRNHFPVSETLFLLKPLSKTLFDHTLIPKLNSLYQIHVKRQANHFSLQLFWNFVVWPLLGYFSWQSGRAHANYEITRSLVQIPRGARQCFLLFFLSLSSASLNGSFAVMLYWCLLSLVAWEPSSVFMKSVKTVLPRKLCRQSDSCWWSASYARRNIVWKVETSCSLTDLTMLNGCIALDHWVW